MNMTFPVTPKELKSMAGKTFVLAHNHRNSPNYEVYDEFAPDVNGECKDGSKFTIEDGVLCLNQNGKIACRFNGVEKKANACYFVGFHELTEAASGFEREVLYEKKMLDQKDVGICISSHVDYEKKTLDRILISIGKAGFDLSKVSVVVAGDDRNSGEESTNEQGVKFLRTNVEAMGFVGLLAASYPYTLLIHDTCEFDKSFVGKVGSVDVGLGPDVVLIQEGSEMGFYAASFVEKVRADVEQVKRMPVLIECVFAKASVIKKAGKKIEVLGERDVYGTGQRRRMVYIKDFGIKKFEGTQKKHGKP